MKRELRRRILRPSTPEEAARHRQIRQEIEQELTELRRWARAVTAEKVCEKGRFSVRGDSLAGASGL